MHTHLHDKLANPIHPFQIQERSPAAFKTHCTANNTSQQYKNTFGVKYSKNTMNKNTFITTAGSENPSRKKVCVQVTLIFLYKCCKSQYIELYSEISILKL